MLQTTMVGGMFITDKICIISILINPGSNSPEISLVRTKSAGTDFRVRTNGRFSNLENSLIRKISTGNKRVRFNESSLYFSLVFELVHNWIFQLP